MILLFMDSLWSVIIFLTLFALIAGGLGFLAYSSNEKTKVSKTELALNATSNTHLAEHFVNSSSFDAFIADNFPEAHSISLSPPPKRYIIYEELIAALKSKFGPGYTMLTSHTNTNSDAESKAIIRLEYKKAHVIFEVSIQNQAIARDKPDRPTGKPRAGELISSKDYYDYTLINYPSSMLIYYNTATKFKLDLVQRIIKDVSRAYPKTTPMPEGDKKAIVTMIAYNKQVGFYSKDEELNVKLMTPEIIDLNYPSVKLAYGDSSELVPMSKVAKFLPTAVKYQENIYILGKPGVGKSVLSAFALYLTKRELNEDIRIFYIPTSVVPSIITPEFTDAMDRIFSKNRINFVLIEECQRLLQKQEGQSTSPLLELLSGPEKELYRLCFALILNADPATLDPALFRSGRAGLIINLNVMDEAQARAKLAQIEKDEMDSETEYIDYKMFEHMLNTPNRYVPENLDEVPYAQPGQMILADIYKCRQNKAKRNMFEEALRTDLLGNKPATRVAKTV